IDRIPELMGRLDAIVRDRLNGVRPVPTIRVDAEIAPDLLTAKLAVELASLEPCGAGNPRPHLLVRDVRVYDIRQVGADSVPPRSPRGSPGSPIDCARSDAGVSTSTR